MIRLISKLACFVLLAAAAGPLRAAVFELANGGRVEGELANPDESPRTKYVVKLPQGGQISLDASQVKQIVEVRPDLAEYEKVRPQYPDTAEGQWNLAEWCREHKLDAQRKTHLKRVIEIDPDHAEARRLLGYSKIEGKWMTQEERMTKEGYRLYRGKWMLPQEIELLENKRKQQAAEQEWFQKIKRWRGWLDGDRRGIARDNLSAIDDPAAVPALTMKLIKTENSQEAKLLYIEALGKIANADADKALAAAAIVDSSEEVRLSSLDVVQKTKNPQPVVKYFIGLLKSKDIQTINRAAIGLSRMKDPSAIPYLIDSLVTSHLQQVGNPGQMSTTFPTKGSPGGIGMGMGGGPKMVRYDVSHQDVLDALVTLTGQNFGFNPPAWRVWYAKHKAQGGK